MEKEKDFGELERDIIVTSQQITANFRKMKEIEMDVSKWASYKNGGDQSHKLSIIQNYKNLSQYFKIDLQKFGRTIYQISKNYGPVPISGKSMGFFAEIPFDEYKLTMKKWFGEIKECRDRIKKYLKSQDDKDYSSEAI